MKDTQFETPITIHEGKFETPFIASIPHSGTDIPSMLAQLYTDDHLSRLRNTDWHLPEIYRFLPSIGVTTLVANFSRYVIDANRGLNQLHGGRSYRSSLITKKDTWGDTILKNPHADLKENFRIANFYMPYHDALKQLIDDKLAKYERVYLLDLHSFAIESDAHICIGSGRQNQFGAQLKKQLNSVFNQYGLTTDSIPKFQGGHIVRHYGAHKNVEACMIELKYNTYMNDSSANGDHMPQINWERATPTITKLKKALTQTVSANSNNNKRSRLTL